MTSLSGTLFCWHWESRVFLDSPESSHCPCCLPQWDQVWGSPPHLLWAPRACWLLLSPASPCFLVPLSPAHFLMFCETHPFSTPLPFLPLMTLWFSFTWIILSFLLPNSIEPTLCLILGWALVQGGLSKAGKIWLFPLNYSLESHARRCDRTKCVLQEVACCAQSSLTFLQEVFNILLYSMPHQQSHSLGHLAVFAVRVCRLCFNLFPMRRCGCLPWICLLHQQSLSRSCQVRKGHCCFWERFCLLVLVSGCVLPKTDDSGPCSTPPPPVPIQWKIATSAPYHLWSPDALLCLGIVWALPVWERVYRCQLLWLLKRLGSLPHWVSWAVLNI